MVFAQTRLIMTCKPVLIFTYISCVFLFCFDLTTGIAYTQPARIIFDTDMDTDCDDTGALAILHTLADRGECEILATIVCSHFPYSAPCTEAINTYFGRPDIPIGVPKGGGASIDRGSRYAKQIAERFPTTLKTNDDAPDAVQVYRKILSQQDDHSVVICSVGYLTNLAYLMASEGDEFTPLSGMELIEQKVKLWVCMGGRYPKHLDPKVYGNFKPDPKSAVKAANELPGRVVFSGLGNDIYTGYGLKELSDDNPVKIAYQLFLRDQDARNSWDPVAVMYAVRPHLDFWKLKEKGYNHIFENGTNEWRDEDKPNHNLLVMDEDAKPTLQNMMEELMTTVPAKK